MNRQVLLSLMIIGIAAVTAGAGTLALFSDTETSAANTFTAGSLDLLIDFDADGDGTVQEDEWFNGDVPAFFDIADVKPGDRYEETVSLHVVDNPAWMCMTVAATADDDNTQTEPEGDVDPDGLTSGELGALSDLFIWVDDGDNVYEPNNPNLTEEVLYDSDAPLMGNPIDIALADSTTSSWGGGPLDGVTDYYIGFEYVLPLSVGNEAQTDSYVLDAAFEAVQHRHNPGFECNPDDVQP